MARKKRGEPWTSYAADPRTTDELIRLVIEEWEMEYEQLPFPSAMTILHARGDIATFNTAKRLAASEAAMERAVAARILGEFGIPERTMLQMLAAEADPEVIGTICSGFTYRDRNPEIIYAVSRFKDHPDASVRFGVVIGLLWAHDDNAVTILTELTRDPDDDVRDWATFGVGQIIDTADEPERWDTPAIRQALFDRIDDPHWETKYEALSGLSLRRDTRIVDQIVNMLVDDDPMAATELCEGLRAMHQHYTGDPEKLKLALSRCSEDAE